MNALLTRIESSDHGTFGRLLAGGLGFYTGELPWRDNQPSISCVPGGSYRAAFTYSPRFGRRLYLVGPVDKRTGIRIHSANLVGDAAKGYRSQLNGCIALGEKLGWMDGQKAILLSAPAMRRFEAFMGGQPFTLEIR